MLNNVVQAVEERQIVDPEEQEMISAITETINALATAKSKKKGIKDQLDEKLKNDPIYASFKEDETEAKDGMKTQKNSVYGTSESQQLLGMEDEAKTQVKELSEVLASQLEVYHEKTRKTVFIAAGRKYTIKKKYSLAPGQQALF